MKAAHRKVNLIFVASPGGGIQAGAWTAQVLTRLNTEMNRDIQDPDAFKRSVCLISSVSGGSLGSMVYTAGIAGLVADPAANARESAIDEVAWGFTQPDFWRAVAPWFGRRTLDRGWALEEKWIAINHLGPKRVGPFERILSGPSRGEDIFLADWARMGVALPALIFNSMLVERGQHVVFSTTDYPMKNDPRGVINFYDLYNRKDFDVRVATAARLSASFPYVAPAARPEIDPYASGFHFVDGGYYDNYGIDSLIGWLSEARTALKDDIGDILILQIRHFDPHDLPGASRQSWAYQAHAPLSGLLSMWNAAPASRDRNELELLLKSFNTDKRHAWLATAQFHGSQKDCAPLSWKLSPGQRQCIDNAWEQVDAQTSDCVRRYLSRTEGAIAPAACQVLP
jgi:hypothetical protein